MKVVLNDDGYINMVVRTGNLINSIEVSEEDLDMRYISCYKLDDDKKNLVLDVEKVQSLENSLKISTLIQSNKFLILIIKY